MSLSKETRLFGEVFWALFGQVASALALLAGTRILTELVTPDIYGQIALLNGFVALGVAVFSYPFICAGMRLIPECRNDLERMSLFRAVKKLTVRSTALAIALMVLGGAIYAYLNKTDISLFALTGVLLATTVRRELGLQWLIGARKQRGASLWQTCDSILRPVLAIGLVWWLGAKAEWILLGYIVASIGANVLCGLFLSDEREAQTSFALASQYQHDVWRYAAALIPMELIFWLNGLGDRYIIGYLMTAADVGLYAATYLIINEAFNRSAMVLLRTFQPAYFQAFSEQRVRDSFAILWLWLGSVMAMGIVGVALLLVCKDWLAGWLLAKSYHAAIELMPAIAVGCVLHALGTVVAQPLLARKRTQSMLKGRLCGALVAAISIPLLVKLYGLPGAALANPVYFGVEVLVLALLAKPWRVAGMKSQMSKDDGSVCRATA
jgi:O-antigen/teichoic acid export membrane protein